MGYRSEVQIYIKEQNNLKIETIIKKLKEIYYNENEITIGTNSNNEKVLSVHYKNK